jgi:hypothetical protein
MAIYAKGKRSLAISDRSGFRVPYRNLKTEWNGLRVSPEEYEPKHPQLDPPKNIIDATALFRPRPDNDPENVIINLAFDGFNTNTGTSLYGNPSLDATTYETPNVGAGAIGRIGAITFSTSATDITGVAGTGQIGTITINTTISVTGVAGTGAIGTITGKGSITESGVAGTGQIGAFGETDGANVQISLTETSVTGTGQIGTVTIALRGWGQETWGAATWGD